LKAAYNHYVSVYGDPSDFTSIKSATTTSTRSPQDIRDMARYLLIEMEETHLFWIAHLRVSVDIPRGWAFQFDKYVYLPSGFEYRYHPADAYFLGLSVRARLQQPGDEISEKEKRETFLDFIDANGKTYFYNFYTNETRFNKAEKPRRGATKKQILDEQDEVESNTSEEHDEFNPISLSKPNYEPVSPAPERLIYYGPAPLQEPPATVAQPPERDHETTGRRVSTLELFSERSDETMDDHEKQKRKTTYSPERLKQLSSTPTRRESAPRKASVLHLSHPIFDDVSDQDVLAAKKELGFLSEPQTSARKEKIVLQPIVSPRSTGVVDKDLALFRPNKSVIEGLLEGSKRHGVLPTINNNPN